MSVEKQEYNGAALYSFIIALKDSEQLVKKLLTESGIERVDPERWYPYDQAVSIFYKIGELVGPEALRKVGRSMIEAAPYPPGIDGVEKLLMSLGAAFSLNARGPGVGTITCTLDDEHSATLDWSAKGPCALSFGILEGSCARYGVTPLIEHGAGGCKDKGDPTCIYHVSW